MRVIGEAPTTVTPWLEEVSSIGSWRKRQL
jgi:hypothetical protein